MHMRVKTVRRSQVVIVYSLNSSNWVAEVGELHEFKASLLCKSSFRRARTT